MPNEQGEKLVSLNFTRIKLVTLVTDNKIMQWFVDIG